ncbi:MULTISPECIES: ABC transporter substrate-binding protein [unclassified Bradyrhizobium]|uniref:ABC transporter substrate-binding protein n=1 Tax=unclassified Bradyrhizobium TaxID=2631580 RepID=UPI001FFA1DBB|nr:MULTISPECIES: ABC transporter substrate-binding protein [unclassified Bradyrhizobium]
MKLISTVGLCLCLALGQAQAEKLYDPGASDSEIRLGQNAAFSGPASSYSITQRVQASFVKAVNDNGGINGRKVVLLQRDEGYSPPKTVEVIRQLVEDDQVLAIVNSFGTPTSAAMQMYLNLRKVPQLLVHSGASRWNNPKDFPWTTPFSPFYSTEGESFARYLLKERPDAKIGVIYQADDIGKDFLKGLHHGLGAKSSTSILKEVSYQVTDPTVDSQLVDLKASGADVVFLAAQNKFAAQAIRKIHEIGWKPLIFVTSLANSISGVLVPAGIEASTGVITTSVYKVPGDPGFANDEGMKRYLTFMKENFPATNPDDISAASGYTAVEIAMEILRRCGDNLTRENLLKQATNLRGLKASMLLPGITIQTAPDD